MEIYIKIFEVIFPVFFVIGIGYYLGKKNPKFDTNFITNFAGNIGTPAMIYYTVTTTGITLDIFISFAAASAVPPVAIKSSIIKTFSFLSMESL